MADAPSLADRINNTLSPISDFVSSIIFYSVEVFGVSLPLVVIWLMVAALVITFSLGFINLRGFRHAWSLVINPHDQAGASGEITHFQALSSALSGTVGLGNIASVPVAIALGGPGAVFWMILAGFFGMSSKFAECALAVKYRKVRPDGSTLGGPMYYIEEVFNRLGLKTLGKAAAIFFAIMAIGASVSIFQVNQSHAQFANVTGLNIPVTFGVIMSAGVAYVILGGIKRIGKVTGLLVPFMGAVYLLAGLVIIAMNITAVPDAFATIFNSAFGLDAAGGGLVGALINGFKRATYSNEAGVGSAAIAHSAVKTNEPLTEGYVALLEPFIDTVVICTMTALVIIITGSLGTEGVTGVALTSHAFESAISWFPYVLAVAVILFAFSTMISWSYYGLKAWTYLFGEGKTTELVFKIIFCIFVVIGAAASLGPVIDFSDAAIFAMAVVNIFCHYFLMKLVKKELVSYSSRLKSGEIRKFTH